MRGGTHDVAEQHGGVAQLAALGHLDLAAHHLLGDGGQGHQAAVVDHGAQEVLGTLGSQKISSVAKWGQLPAGARVTKTPVLFPRLESAE